MPEVPSGWGLIYEARVHLRFQLSTAYISTSETITTQHSHLPYSHEDAWLFSSASRSALKVCASCDACASAHPVVLAFAAQCTQRSMRVTQ